MCTILVGSIAALAHTAGEIREQGGIAAYTLDVLHKTWWLARVLKPLLLLIRKPYQRAAATEGGHTVTGACWQTRNTGADCCAHERGRCEGDGSDTHVCRAKMCNCLVFVLTSLRELLL